MSEPCGCGAPEASCSSESSATGDAAPVRISAAATRGRRRFVGRSGRKNGDASTADSLVVHGKAAWEYVAALTRRVCSSWCI